MIGSNEKCAQGYGVGNREKRAELRAGRRVAGWTRQGHPSRTFRHDTCVTRAPEMTVPKVLDAPGRGSAPPLWPGGEGGEVVCTPGPPFAHKLSC